MEFTEKEIELILSNRQKEKEKMELAGRRADALIIAAEVIRTGILAGNYPDFLEYAKENKIVIHGKSEKESASIIGDIYFRIMDLID